MPQWVLHLFHFLFLEGKEDGHKNNRTDIKHFNFRSAGEKKKAR